MSTERNELEKLAPSEQIEIIEQQDNKGSIIEELNGNLLKPGNRILLLSGSHGYELIKQKSIQEWIKTNKVFVIWVGHQDPGFITNKDLVDFQLFTLIGLPMHIVEEKPALKDQLRDRLITMEAVPNTLKEKDLLTAKENWNTQYPKEKIPNSPNGYIGIFLGGDAPKPDGTVLYWDEKDAYKLGLSFGKFALQEEKLLLITNGPRTGKFYPESPDNYSPLIRQFKNGKWQSFSQLSEQDKKNPNKDQIVHAPNAPMDPVSLSFIQGIKDSGLEKTKYQFFDFKYGKSAYNAIIATLYVSKEKSIACYSGESISYAEIAYFIPHTFVFSTNSMNTGHQNALRRFSKDLFMVGNLDFNKSLQAQLLDISKKKEIMKAGNQQDALKIVNAFLTFYHQDKKAEEKVGTSAPLTFALDTSKTPMEEKKSISSPSVAPFPEIKPCLKN